MSKSPSIISLTITQFPQNILIPNMNNAVNIQAINNSTKNEKFQFVFEGENLRISISSEEFKDQIDFAPGETKNINLTLNPEIDGFGKFNINVFWLKIVEYTVKVQKVRESVPESQIRSLLDKYAFKELKKHATLNPKDYFIEMSLKELKKSEEQLDIMKKNYNSPPAVESTSLVSSPPVSLEDINENIRIIAKGYITNKNLLKSLEFALQLSDAKEQITFYSNLIRVYAFENLDQVIEIIKNLQDEKRKQDLFIAVVLDQIPVNPISALKLAEKSEDLFLQINILFNISRVLHEKSQTSELNNIFNRIIELIIKAFERDNGKKNQKQSYEILIDVLCIVAEITNPSITHSIIEGINQQELKEKLTKDIFDTIYIMIDEIRTKIESELVFSQYFLLNTYVSNVNKEIKNFSTTGGNVSNNILSGDFNFKLIFLSLFRFSFSIFPIIDRVYNEVKFNMKKSMGYYVFPSIKNYQDTELATLKTTITQFFRNFGNLTNQLHVINLDFIPYLGKPTIILSSEDHLNEDLKSKIKSLGEKVNLIIDDSIFKGGKIYEFLKEIFPPAKSEVINLLLSYEFINDYNLMIEFIQTLL